MTRLRLLGACIGLVTLLGACERDPPVPADEIPPASAQQQAEPVPAQTWEPIQKPENALPLRNMPVPDEVLIAEMAAADAGPAQSAEQQMIGPPAPGRPAATQATADATQAALPQQAAADADVEADND